VGSGTVRELRDWVEYCNFSGDSTWAQQRAADGSSLPLDVIYWGVGNENWGCGGHFSPEDYCTEYRRYASFLRGFGKSLYLIACGPSGNDVEWTNRFFRKLQKDYWEFKNIHGYAAHYYCGTAGTATEYTENQWYELLDKALRMEGLVVQQRAAMDAYDPARRIGLIVDEWGTWHPVEKGTHPSFLYQQSTMRDALVAATTLDIFNRHADKVVMANIAQTVNVLQAVILTQANQMLVTPTGYVYELYAGHQGGQALRSRVNTPQVVFQKAGQEVGFPLLAGSASLKDKTLYLTLTNSHAVQELETTVEIVGARAVHAARGRLLSGEIHAHNTFEEPAVVAPAPLTARIEGNRVIAQLPGASVAALELTLA
jgi:alpha-N-arabinofuranosidase